MNSLKKEKRYWRLTSDYETAVITAEATLARARLALAEEEANAAQARTDWGRLNPGIEPPELVSREPQLAQARADVASAEARVENARLNLERTTITAPMQVASSKSASILVSLSIRAVASRDLCGGLC